MELEREVYGQVWYGTVRYGKGAKVMNDEEGH